MLPALLSSRNKNNFAQVSYSRGKSDQFLQNSLTTCTHKYSLKMMSQMEIPEDMKQKIMAQLGVSSEHIDEALSLAQKSPNVGVTPFLQHMRKVSEFFKTFKNEKEKLKMFAQCSSLEDRVHLVYQAILSHPEYKDVRNMFPEQRYKTADVEKSKQCRDKGNKLYQAKQFREAIKTYTESCVNTVIDENGKSRELSLALGNRYEKEL